MAESKFDYQLNAVMAKVANRINNATKRAVNMAALGIAASPELTMENIGFHSVTGNLWKSIGVAATYTNPKTHKHDISKYYPSKGSKKEIAPTLAPGQDLLEYRKKAYYSGMKLSEDSQYQYVKYKAPEDSPEPGHRRGVDERNRYFELLKGDRSRAKNVNAEITFFAGLPYAEYVNQKHRIQWFDVKSQWFRDRIFNLVKSNFFITK